MSNNAMHVVTAAFWNIQCNLYIIPMRHRTKLVFSKMLHILHLYLGLKLNFSSLSTMRICNIFWCDEYLAVLMLGAYRFVWMFLHSSKKLMLIVLGSK